MAELLVGELVPGRDARQRRGDDQYPRARLVLQPRPRLEHDRAPWEVEGISRAWWYRKRQHALGVDRSQYSYYPPGARLCFCPYIESEANRPQGASLTTCTGAEGEGGSGGAGLVFCGNLWDAGHWCGFGRPGRETPPKTAQMPLYGDFSIKGA